MANWTKTVKLSQVIQLMRIGSGNYHARDPHIHVGKGSGDKSNWTGRGQFGTTVIDSDWWPASGKIVDATISGKTGATGQHSAFRGSNAGIEIRALTEKGAYGSDATADGYYTGNGGGDVYPGASSTGTGSVTFSVSSDSGKSFSRSVRAIIEARMPKRIARRNGSAGGGGRFYGVQVRSANEDSSSRSAIISDDLYLTVEIDVNAKPSSPLIVELVGAQPDTEAPVIVGSTDGRTLEVVFAFRSEAAGDTCAKAELQIFGIGATDETPGPILYTTGAIVPQDGGSANVHRIRLTGLPLRLAGRPRVITTSNKGKVGDPSSLEDQHFRLATIPGAPLDIVVQPFTDTSHVLFSLNSPDPADTVSGGRAVYTLLPQGTLAWDSGMVDIGGSTRRADLVYGGTPLPDGQRVSVRVQTRNQDGVVGTLSAPKEQTMRDRRGPTVTPDPGRLTSRRPTFAISDATFDGHRERLLQPDDSSSVIHDSGGQVVSNQTSVNWQVPAGVLAFGQPFQLVASTLPDGGSEYGVESNPQAYSIGSLPVCGVSIVDAYLRRVQTRDIPIARTVTDPDGAAISGIDMEVRVAATPAGSGALIERRWDTGSIPAVARLGRTIDLLTSAAGWVADANAAVAAYSATAPSGYASASSVQVQATGTSSTTRGARLGLPVPLDLSAYGSGTRLRLQCRLTSTTNLNYWAIQFTFATSGDYVRYGLLNASATLNTWTEVIALLGSPTVTSGTVDWSNVTAIHFIAVCTGNYAGSLQARDLRIGTTQSAKTVPDGHLAWESGIDVRIRATNDLDGIASTTLASQANAGATTISLTSAAGFAIGQTIVIAGTIPEVREITNLVSTTATLSDALAHTHASGQTVNARPFSQPTPWVTVSALQPPDVTLTAPADAATITRPWHTLSWSFTGHGGRTLARSTVRILNDQGEAIAALVVSDTEVDIPAFLLDDEAEYAWDVEVTDTDGLVTRSAQRTFTTDFAVPEPLGSLSAEPDPDGRGVVLTWDASPDPDLHHYVLEWLRRDGTPVRIDVGPESLLDGRTPFRGTTATHIGAALGDNSYRLSQHNGWAQSEAVSADAEVIEGRVPGWTQLVDGEGVLEFPASRHPRNPNHVHEVQTIPGVGSQVLKFGRSGGEHQLSLYLPDILDLWAIRDEIEARASRPSGMWLKDRKSEPAWVTVTTVADPGTDGESEAETRLEATFQEVRYPVHSILPPPPEPEEPEPVLEPHASLDFDGIDFGSVEI